MSGVWPPSVTTTPSGVFHIDDVHHIFEGQRLEIKLVGGVVVSRDRLGVAVDHDGLEAGVGKRVALAITQQ